MTTRPAVLLTDYAWPDLMIEAAIIEGAGLRLVSGPAKPATAEAIAALAAEHQPAAIMTNWAPVSAAAIAVSAPLRIVARLGVGLDNIAVDEATRRGVWVTNVPDYCIEEVSDHAVAMLLAWARGLVHFDGEVRAGRWEPAGARLRRVHDLTCGIIGLGRTGQRTAQKLRGFGVRLLGHARRADRSLTGVETTTLEELLSRSDVVIVHVPLTADTHHLLGRERIALMKPGAFLVNVSRGAVIDTRALSDALESGRLGGAALDVLEDEPRVPPGLLRPDVILTPHVAFSSDASLRELRSKASEEVVRVLRGERPREARNEPR
ncbi:MAG TPA: C-terminal binding protein [Steroidobacteraceae bacterium]|jgi:D-3-phosphoglycerate dehydrogenase|nr:C-terminal binding protein [Steroidobacteraceae bacterium]